MLYLLTCKVKSKCNRSPTKTASKSAVLVKPVRNRKMGILEVAKVDVNLAAQLRLYHEFGYISNSFPLPSMPCYKTFQANALGPLYLSTLILSASTSLST